MGVRNVIPCKNKALSDAGQLLRVHEKENIQILVPGEEGYPQRLLHCCDAPPVLYWKGKRGVVNTDRVISVVGTRKPTAYGKQMVAKLVEGLRSYATLIVSGLAYGIDIEAHREALHQEIPTVAVVANGLDRVYPAMHRKTVQEILSEGGVISEYPLGVAPLPHHFIARNRVIAGMADVTIVVEAGEKSGSLITAGYANDYSREVCTVPGRVGDPYAIGCHHLIQNFQAHLITSAEDIAKLMRWGPIVSQDRHPSSLRLSQAEQKIVEALGCSGQALHVDALSYQVGIPSSQLSAILLQLELKQVIRTVPGKKLQLR